MTAKTSLTALIILFKTCFLFAQHNEISLLNSRFSFVFPDSAKNVQRATDIMSANPNANNETRVIYDKGEMRMVFFAEELYIKNTSDLEKKITTESTPAYPVTVKTIFNQDSVQCFAVTPFTFDDKQDAILINSLMIKNADQTISKVSVYLNPKAFTDKSAFDKITDQVFASFKKGSRRLNLKSHTESFPVLDTKTSMQLKLPEDYIVTLDKKYDFEVYKLHKVVAYGATNFADLTVYCGFHPSFFNTAYQMESFKTADVNGTFGSKKATWMNFKDTARGLLVREQMFADDAIEKGAIVHVAMISNKQNIIDELTLIVKDISLKYK